MKELNSLENSEKINVILNKNMAERMPFPKVLTVKYIIFIIPTLI
jgi:hypothetical protein